MLSTGLPVETVPVFPVGELTGSLGEEEEQAVKSRLIMNKTINTKASFLIRSDPFRRFFK